MQGIQNNNGLLLLDFVNKQVSELWTVGWGTMGGSFGVPFGSKVYYQCDTLIILRDTLIILRATVIILRATLNNKRGT